MFGLSFPPLRSCGSIIRRTKKSEEKEGGIAKCALIPAALIADLPEGNNDARHQVHHGDCSLASSCDPWPCSLQWSAPRSRLPARWCCASTLPKRRSAAAKTSSATSGDSSAPPSAVRCVRSRSLDLDRLQSLPSPSHTPASSPLRLSPSARLPTAHPTRSIPHDAGRSTLPLRLH